MHMYMCSWSFIPTHMHNAPRYTSHSLHEGIDHMLETKIQIACIFYYLGYNKLLERKLIDSHQLVKLDIHK
jgi:hypothetical protein